YSTSILFILFTNPSTTQIYTLSLHDALPISAAERGGDRRLQGLHEGPRRAAQHSDRALQALPGCGEGEDLRPHAAASGGDQGRRSEEHTSELQSRRDLVCRLLLEKKKKKHET